MQLEGAFSYNFQLVNLYTANNAHVDYDKQLLLYAAMWKQWKVSRVIEITFHPSRFFHPKNRQCDKTTTQKKIEIRFICIQSHIKSDYFHPIKE